MDTVDNSKLDKAFVVALGQAAHAIAQQRAAIAAPQCRRRVYLSALAMAATQQYFDIFQLETEIVQLPPSSLFDWATLAMYKTTGSEGIQCDGGAFQGNHIECRPVLPGETQVFIPAEAMANRLGYVAVQLNQTLTEGHLLGFLAALSEQSTEHFEVTALASMTALLEKFSLTQPALSTSAHNPFEISLQRSSVVLSRWFDQPLDQGWQLLTTLMNSLTEPKLSFRSANADHAVSGGRLIDLGLQFADTSLALIINLSPVVEGLVGIQVQLCPVNMEYLPLALSLMILDEESLVQRQVSARSQDNLIQIAFEGALGEKFQVKVMLGNFSVTDVFTI
jgi:hypothetical protein